MTDVEAPALHMAVASRLRARRTLTWRVWVPVIVSLSACAVVVVMYRSTPGSVKGPGLEVAVPPSREAIGPTRSKVEARTVAAAQVRQVAAPQASSLDPEAGLPALPTITALPVSEIQPAALDIPQLTVAPLAPIAPLVVPPLGEIDRQP